MLSRYCNWKEKKLYAYSFVHWQFWHNMDVNISPMKISLRFWPKYSYLDLVFEQSSSNSTICIHICFDFGIEIEYYCFIIRKWKLFVIVPKLLHRSFISIDYLVSCLCLSQFIIQQSDALLDLTNFTNKSRKWMNEDG